jgi:hypothetical protein
MPAIVFIFAPPSLAITPAIRIAGLLNAPYRFDAHRGQMALGQLTKRIAFALAEGIQQPESTRLWFEITGEETAEPGRSLRNLFFT